MKDSFYVCVEREDSNLKEKLDLSKIKIIDIDIVSQVVTVNDITTRKHIILGANYRDKYGSWYYINTSDYVKIEVNQSSLRLTASGNYYGDKARCKLLVYEIDT